MPQHHERALVLDVADYRETSSLVRLFTEHEGRVTLVARGLRKSKGTSGTSILQPFNAVSVRFFMREGATMGTFAGAELEHSAAAPHASLEAYAVISYWFEILKETTQERAAIAVVFDLTAKMLQNQQRSPGLTVDFLMQLTRLCDSLGFGITWDQCSGCGKELRAPAHHFSVGRGGAACENCVEDGLSALSLQPAELSIVSKLAGFRLLDNIPSHEPLPEHRLAMLNVLHRFLVYHLEHPLQTIRFLNDICG